MRNPFSPWQPAIIVQAVLSMVLRGIFLVRGTMLPPSLVQAVLSHALSGHGSMLSCSDHGSHASGRLALLTDAVESSERIIARRLDPESASKKLDKKGGKGPILRKYL